MMDETRREAMVEIHGLSKAFTLHHQHQAKIRVVDDVHLSVASGECVALTGQSGCGKSTVMRLIYGNYLAEVGHMRVGALDVATASPHEILEMRRTTLGYVSQFLRVLPRVPTLRVVAEPMMNAGADEAESLDRARALLTRLRIPEQLWDLSPLTFSGGEKQRVNVARGFTYAYPVMLLDEPTASLDATNRDTVLELIAEAKARGAALIGIFHDVAVRERVCDREIDISQFSAERVPQRTAAATPHGSSETRP